MSQIPLPAAPEKVYGVLLAALALAAVAALVAVGVRRAPQPTDRPRRLSALAGFGFWLALLSFGLVSAGFVLMTLIHRADLFDLGRHDFDEMLIGATVVGICAAAFAGLSTLVSVSAIAAVRGNGRYGLGLAMLSLWICAVAMAGTYIPKAGLNAQIDAVHRAIKPPN